MWPDTSCDTFTSFCALGYALNHTICNDISHKTGAIYGFLIQVYLHCPYNKMLIVVHMAASHLTAPTVIPVLTIFNKGHPVFIESRDMLCHMISGRNTSWLHIWLHAMAKGQRSPAV